MKPDYQFFLVSRKDDHQPLLVVPGRDAAEAIARTARACASVMDWIPNRADQLTAVHFLIGHAPQPGGVGLVSESFFAAFDEARTCGTKEKTARPEWLRVIPPRDCCDD